MTARSSELVFTGKPGDCKPKMYISVKKKVQRENTYLEDAEEDQELLDAFLIQIFQRGLSGPALYWIEKKRLSEETFSEIERRFLEKYQLTWVEREFGSEHIEAIISIMTHYGTYAARSKFELLEPWVY
ncbi:hypothetical protein ACHAQC_006721 [Fusarium culmorum]